MRSIWCAMDGQFGQHWNTPPSSGPHTLAESRVAHVVQTNVGSWQYEDVTKNWARPERCNQIMAAIWQTEADHLSAITPHHMWAKWSGHTCQIWVRNNYSGLFPDTFLYLLVVTNSMNNFLWMSCGFFTLRKGGLTLNLFSLRCYSEIRENTKLFMKTSSNQQPAVAVALFTSSFIRPH